MAQTTLGVEIDGDRITVVECVGEMAVSVRSVELDDPADAVDLALAGMKTRRNDPSIRVGLAAPSMVARRIDITSSMSSRTVFEEAVYTAMPVDRTATCTAGIFHSPDLITDGIDQLGSGFAAVATRASVDRAYRAMGDRRAEVVPAPFTFEGSDGLWLGIRHGVTDVTLVVDGHVQAYRQLRVGGLDTVAGLLVDPADPESGRDRLAVALHRTGASDPVAEAELDRWMRTLALELRQTVDYWSRGGEQPGQRVIAHGAGAVAVGLLGALGEAGLESWYPDELNRMMAFIAPADRPLAIGAFMAARSTGTGMPQAAFIDPSSGETKAETKRRNRRLLVVGAVSTLVAVLVGSIVVPTVGALVQRNSARSDLSAAREVFTPVQSMWNALETGNIRRGIVAENITGEVNYAKVLRTVTGTAPDGYLVSQLNATRNETGNVTATATLSRPGGDYRELSAWLTLLRATPEVSEAWVSSFANRDGTVSFEITVTFDNTKVLSDDRTILNGGQL